jgi:hypothetical protein
MKGMKWMLVIMALFFMCMPQLGRQDLSAKASTVKKEGKIGLGPYWFEGKAEINHYTLSQNRYRDLHPGEAVLVFVTEPFLTDKQVKNDQGQKNNSTTVLKLNNIQRFTTGIYDYSVMTSVFTPEELKRFPHSLKVTSSSQDWCGQTFMQINQDKENYKVEMRSYFENEGDQNLSLPQALLEDEVWTRLRMGPDALPLGAVQVYPSAMYTRLMHKPFKTYTAEAKLAKYEGNEIKGNNLKVYQLNFPELERKLEIVFQDKEPYLIEGWMDSHPALLDKQMRQTIAKRTHTLLEAYWQKNNLKDLPLRKDLGMD